jgi:hypothetical protein
MIRTGKPFLAPFTFEQTGGAMGADIVKRVDDCLAFAHQYQAFSGNIANREVAFIFQRFDMTGKLPAGAEYLILFELKDIRLGVNRRRQRYN